MAKSSNLTRNRLLLALPARDLKRIAPELERIPRRRGQVLLDADSSLDAVFFPDSGVVSALAIYADGSLLLRWPRSAGRAVRACKPSSAGFFVQIPGSAVKMPRAAFARALQSVPSFQSMTNAYVQAFLEQVLVSVACNGALMMRDRSDDDVLPITQSLLAEMLGAQRPSITNVARELENAGLIEGQANRLAQRLDQGTQLISIGLPLLCINPCIPFTAPQHRHLSS